jgi:hypothetical protein
MGEAATATPRRAGSGAEEASRKIARAAPSDAGGRGFIEGPGLVTPGVRALPADRDRVRKAAGALRGRRRHRSP